MCFYSAPEIFASFCDGGATGYSSPIDWWSLGVCAYEMRKGKVSAYTPAVASSAQNKGGVKLFVVAGEHAVKSHALWCHHIHECKSHQMHFATKLTRSSWEPTISLGSHQNIGLHTGARANVGLLTYLLTYLLA